MLRLLPRDSERRCAGAPTPRDTRRLLGVGARSWHVTRRARAEGERPLAGVVLFYRHGPTATSAARRARSSQLECCTSSQETASAGAQARLRFVTRGACLALEASACTSHHGRAPKKTGPSPTQCPLFRHKPTTTSEARRMRSKFKCCTSSLETASAGMPAWLDTRRLLGVGDRSLHVVPRARAEEERPLADAVLFYRHGPTASSAARPARAVASSSVAPSPKRQRAQVRRRAYAS